MKGSSSTSDIQVASPRRAFQFRNGPLLLLVGLAALGTFVVTPRPTRPRTLPLPQVDAVALRARETEESHLAREARAHPLDTATRTVGEEFRRLNAASSTGSSDQARLEYELRRDVTALLGQGHARDLLSLRALQSELFLRALREAWPLPEGSSAASGPLLELRELGGSFLELARSSYAGPEGELLLGDDDLRLVFRVHWGRVCGVHRSADFGPSLEEFRRYYALQLRYPQGGLVLDDQRRALVRLQAIRAFAEIDREYPSDLAEGLLLLDAGFAADASERLRRHMEAEPDGPWSLVARNARLAAVRASDP